MWKQSLPVLLGLCAVVPGALSQSLEAALLTAGLEAAAEFFNGLADIEEQADNSASLIVYAPTDAALTVVDSNITSGGGGLSRRDAAENAKQYQIVIALPVPMKRRHDSSSDYGYTSDAADLLLNLQGSVYESLLSDPEVVNLGPDRNQSVVEIPTTSNGSGYHHDDDGDKDHHWHEKRCAELQVCNQGPHHHHKSFPVVFTGLGERTNVVGKDIPFDGGVIRPVDSLFTIPVKLSETLAHLGLDIFLNALSDSSSSCNSSSCNQLLETLDEKPRITVFAPLDECLKLFSEELSPSQLADFIKAHVLVDTLAYTPFLQDGRTFETLAGTRVTVTVETDEDGSDVQYVNGARIVRGDALLENGVLHVVDAPLVPVPDPEPVISSTTPVPGSVPTTIVTTTTPAPPVTSSSSTIVPVVPSNTTTTSVAVPSTVPPTQSPIPTAAAGKTLIINTGAALAAGAGVLVAFAAAGVI